MIDFIKPYAHKEKPKDENTIKQLVEGAEWKIMGAAAGDADVRSMSVAARGAKRKPKASLESSRSIARNKNKTVPKIRKPVTFGGDKAPSKRPSNASTTAHVAKDPLNELLDLDYFFVRHSRNRELFFQRAVRKYDIMDVEGKLRFYAMEVKGGTIYPVEGEGEIVERGCDCYINLLSLAGQALLTVHATKPTKITGSHYKVYRGQKLMATIIQSSGKCSDPEYNMISDDEREFGKIMPSNSTKRVSSCLNFCCTKLTQTEKAVFDVHLPSRRRVMARMGKISKVIPTIPAQFKTWYGIEYNKEVPMGIFEKSVLLASLFILKIPNKSWS